MRLVLDDPHSAEDATDRVFASVLAQLPRHQLRRAPFRVWLFASARTVAVQELLRLSAAESRRRSDEDGAASFSPMPAWISDRQLQGLIGRLSRPHRQVLFLLYRAGLESNQGAARLAGSAHTSRRPPARAMRAPSACL